MLLARRLATETTCSFEHTSKRSPDGIVSVTTTLVNTELLSRSRAGPESTPCVGTGVHFAGAFAEQDFGSGADRPCRIDDVIHEYRDLAVHIADDVRGGRLVGAVAALVDDGEGRFNALGEGAGAFHAAGVGGNHHDLALHGHEGVRAAPETRTGCPQGS